MAQGSKMLFAFVCSSPMSPLKTKVLGGISVCFLLSQDAAVLHGTPPYFVQACGCQNKKKHRRPSSKLVVTISKKQIKPCMENQSKYFF